MRKMVKFASLCLAAMLSLIVVPKNNDIIMASENYKGGYVYADKEQEIKNHEIPEYSTRVENLTDEYILSYLKDGKKYADFTYVGSIELSRDTLQYIKDNKIDLTIRLLSADEKVVVNYRSFDEFVNEEIFGKNAWDGNSSLRLYQPVITTMKDKQCFSNEPLMAYTFNGNDNSYYYQFYSCEAYAVGIDDQVIYGIGQDHIIGGGDICCGVGIDGSIYYVTTKETSARNDIEGMGSVKDKIDLSECGTAIYNGDELNPEFIKLVNNIQDGGSITAYFDTDTCDADMEEFNAILENKKFKLTIYYGYVIEDSKFYVWNKTTYELDGKSKVTIYGPDLYMNNYVYMDPERYMYAPEKLFKNTNYATFDVTAKVYGTISMDYINGTNMYLYKADYDKRQLELVDTYTVHYGEINYGPLEEGKYFATTEPFTNTKWTVEDETIPSYYIRLVGDYVPGYVMWADLNCGGTYGKLPDLKYDGYVFDGWYTEENGGIKIEENTPVTLNDNQTLYAHWTRADEKQDDTKPGDSTDTTKPSDTKTDDSASTTTPSDTKKDDSASATKPSDTKKDDSANSSKPSSTASKKTTYADGLNQINGEWVYCKNNKIDTSYTGLCKYNGSWWYVKNGKVDFSATTLCKYNGSWFYVSSGKVNFNYTGLCKYNGSWFYVNGGKVNFSYTGLCKYNGSWWYIKGGQVSFTTTLCKYNGSWWYVKNGQVDFKTTGLCKYNGAWWYVKGGKVSFTTTLCKYNGTWWYVKNGKVDFSSTTLCKYGNAWYCVSGGKVAWNYTGLCKYGSAWYYVQKGVVNFKTTTLTKYAGTWWYVKNGVLNTSTTLCKYGNSWFAVSGGKVAWGYSGTMKYNGGTYNVVNGKVIF